MGSRRPRADAAPFNIQHYNQQSLKQGETLRYALILCNVYKRGIQKVKFTIKKQEVKRMQGELPLGDAPPACISSTRNYLGYLDIPCWYLSIRPSYLPSAMSWTPWSARLSSLMKNY